MLVEFSIENYASIKEEVTYSLLAANDRDQSLTENLIVTSALKEGEKLSKTSVISGPNASGKSNVIMALGHLRELVLFSHQHQVGTALGHRPFKLDKKCLSKPTKFEIIFIQNNIQYTYGVSFTDDKIIDEYLYYYPRGKKATIFERTNTDNHYCIQKEKKVQKDIFKNTLKNALFLSKSAQQSYDKTYEPFKWFNDKLRVVSATERIGKEITVDMINKNENLKKTLLNFINKADIEIDNINASIEEMSVDDLPNVVRDALKIEDEKINKTEIRTSRKLKDGSNEIIDFDYNEESEGTRKLFTLVGPIVDTLINGRILVIDELDVKLHHFLNLFLINIFHDASQNPNNAQLIFTTHNLNLLNLDIFRRDQIWFTDKIPETGSTDLYSLVEFGERKDRNIRKAYLVGRYGAKPFIPDTKVL